MERKKIAKKELATKKAEYADTQQTLIMQPTLKEKEITELTLFMKKRTFLFYKTSSTG